MITFCVHLGIFYQFWYQVPTGKNLAILIDGYSHLQKERFHVKSIQFGILNSFPCSQSVDLIEKKTCPIFRALTHFPPNILNNDKNYENYERFLTAAKFNFRGYSLWPVQGCQMVHFHTKNPNLNKFFFGGGLAMDEVVYFMAIWSIVWTFGIFVGYLV
jgi:hypothetical protein